MRSLLGRFHRPFARSAEEQLLLLNNLGDGSTLSLDFTTGILDPRLTFTRSTNATFINSNGLVQWANSNMYWNTAFEGLSGTNPSLTSSGWGYAFSTGNAVFNGDKTVTITTTASDRRALFRSSGLTGGGLRVVASVDVTIHSGSLQASQVIVTGTPTNAQHYVNGTIWNASHPLWNGGILPVGSQFNISYATDSLTSGTTSMYFGVGCTSAIAGSATFSNPRWTMWNGSGTVPYYPNTSATNGPSANYFKSNDYQAPRFDHDPTAIGTPRGLLIEGSANNLWTYSQDQSQWAVSNVTVNTGTQATAPDGTTSLFPVLTNTTSVVQYFVRQRSADSITATAGQVYTYSMFVKKDTHRYVQMFASATTIFTSAAQANFDLNDGTTGNVTNCTANAVPYGNGWWRLSITVTANASGTQSQPFLLYLVSSKTAARAENLSLSSQSIYVWGAQVELGSGASSYIPTGASQGSRAADVCYADNISSWYTQGIGTMLFVGRPIQSIARNYLGFSTGTNPPRLLLYGSTATEVALYLQNSTAANLVVSSGSTTLGSVNRMAASFEQAGYSCVLNGGTVGTSTTASPAMPTSGINRMNIGMRNDQLNQFFGHVVQVKYWPYRLPNAQLQSLTT